MAIDIVMPALSPGMEKGHLARWLKAEGDTVKIGDVIAEIETDKATLELEASADGVLRRILVPAGAHEVLVNQTIAILGLAASQAKTPAPATPASAISAPADDPAADEPDSDPPAAVRAGAVSPRARLLAREFGIDLSSVQGSGPQGRILERNVRDVVTAAMTQRPIPQAAPPHPAIATTPHEEAQSAFASRPALLGRDTPQLQLMKAWQVDSLLDLQERVNAALPRDERGEAASPVTITDMLIRAWALALHQAPDANVVWTDDKPACLGRVDIAFTVSTAGGLVTPVLRSAESKSITAIACETGDLAARARSGQLSPGDCRGGSSTIANLGMFGIDSFTAVVSPAQATSLAIGAIEKRVVVRSDAPAIARMLSVTLSADRRAVDDACGASLMARFGTLLTTPLQLLA
ncbi:MAG: 2-oxo acid dehydrogenase subunit E2 [Bosea sp.]|uniref:dihydrolipoamide acetyltransferase family protein n=1 Tax=Bosea sp. (in: a-proteobacteria) TaxID=1871050 RepID=UPI002386EC5B|nr:2-oxo acid dehydrogenase subunit E2 [Bosea sp. (in: a-proteobacteria)]MCP4738381.1 2-oxo acid dehydrogenase subunit E2 [Bosea sp. (in: a-proteobacteria)]